MPRWRAREPWCIGPCGRELPASAFRVKDGYLLGTCRQCEALYARERFRRLYRISPRFRRVQLRRAKANYAKRRAA